MNNLDYKKLSIFGVVFLIVASLFLLAETVVAMKSWQDQGTNKDTRAEISVSGKGEVKAVPDTATFSFSVIEIAATVQAAQDAATALTNKSIDYLKKAGIKDVDIQTQGYNVDPQYTYSQPSCADRNTPCPPGKQVLTGYEVSQTIQVKLRDTSQSGTILAGLGTLGVQNISGLNLTIDNEDALNRQARQKAIDDAKSKAEALAHDLGVQLIRITSYSEQGTSPIYYGAMAKGLDSAVPAAAPQIPTGQNTITSNVTITYEIR